MGKAPRKQVETVKGHVEAIVKAKMIGTSIDRDTAAWLRDLQDRPYNRLVELGLVPSRGKTATVRLAAYLDDYIAGRKDVKPSTRDHLKRATE